MNVIEPRVNETLIDEIKKIVLEYNNFLEIKNNNINYINLYQKNLQLNKHDYLLAMIQKVEPINLSLKNNTILYYGYIVSQPGNKNQYFHIDYKGKTITYFIPLVDLNDKNGTEYLFFYDNTNYNKFFDLFIKITKKYIERSEIIDILSTYDIIYMKDYEFKYVNAPAFSLLSLPNNVFHRGRTNETDHYRVMFQITIELEPIDYIVNEEFINIAENDD